MTLLWLNGLRYNEAVCFDPESGSGSTFLADGAVTTTAGIARPFGRWLIAVYIEDQDGPVIVQAGRHRWTADGTTSASVTRRPFGLRTTLTITGRDGAATLIGRNEMSLWFRRKFNPLWDGIDESIFDTAAILADILNSEDSRRRFIALKHPSAGPWELVDRES